MVDAARMETSDAMGAELVFLSQRVFASQEEKLQGQIRQLEETRAEMQMLSESVRQLAMRKGEDKIDLNQGAVKELVVAVHRLFPSLFEGLIENFPEGLLSQDVELDEPSYAALIEACNKDVCVHDVTISLLTSHQVDALIQGIEGLLDIKVGEVSHINSKITAMFNDRADIAKTMREMLEQLRRLLSHINEKR